MGRDILRQGGNAVDAAVAVGFALAVVHPEAGQPRRRRVHGDSAPGWHGADARLPGDGARRVPPATCTSTSRGTDRASVTGHLAAGVPGAVAGLTEAHRRYGRLPLRGGDRARHPAGAATGSWSTSTAAARSETTARGWSLFPASRATLPPQRRAPVRRHRRSGQPDLGATLEAIRDSGAAGFYRGRVADLIVAEMERGGGLITPGGPGGIPGDLARSRSRSRYRGYTIYSMPPASSGGVTMGEILNIMEGYDPLPPFGSAALMHREAEAMRRAFTDRNTLSGRPGVRPEPARPAAVQGVRRRAAQADRRARLADPDVRRRRPRRRLDDPLLGGGRRRATR